jgi:hypothetical protein
MALPRRIVPPAPPALRALDGDYGDSALNLAELCAVHLNASLVHCHRNSVIRMHKVLLACD